jgi:putative transposase
MRSPYTQLYLHLVWATWDRLPLITPAIEARLYAEIARKCRELGCIPLAIGGVPDHVHVLLRGNATLPVATIVKEVKGSSSHLANHVLTKDAFKWQGSYSAFTLRKSEAPLVKAYVERQKQHHEVGDLWEEWERIGTEEKESSIA